MGRVASWDEAARLLDEARREGKRIVFTNGCFDLLHRGHVDLLAAARARGDLLVVGLNDDDSVRRLKGEGRPWVRGEDRAAVLAALAAVDLVVLFGEDTPRELVRRLRPHVLVKGGDYRPEDVVGRDEVEAQGGEVVIVPLTEGRSTTGLGRSIRGGEDRDRGGGG
jgi:D-beta-D-heptose 7-phosphate kinase/D-beta-D-heptose 1-phosphate adenosyltransferase